MKLYYSPGACSLSPHIVLREAGVPFDLVKVDLKTKTMAGGGDYRAVNPLGYVPLLELDDGIRLHEGPAIVQYVAEKAGRVGPKDLVQAAGTFERAQLQSWLNFIATELHKGSSPLFNPALGDDAKAIFKMRLLDRLASFDQHMQSNAYVMGDTLTVADAYAFTITGWARALGLDISNLKAITAYRERMSARPAVQAAMKAEGLIK